MHYNFKRIGLSRMEKIGCAVIDSRRFFVFISMYMMLGTALTAFVVMMSHHTIYIWIGLGIFWLLPAVIQKPFQRPFSKQAIFEFSSDELAIQIFSQAQDESRIELPFRDIGYFRAIESYKDDTAYLKLFLKNGESFKYNLLDQKPGDGNIIEMVFRYFKNYNHSISEDASGIRFVSSFFGSSRGKNFIWALTIVLGIAIVLQIVLLPKSIPASVFMGLSMYLIIWQQRKKDVRLNERLNS